MPKIGKLPLFWAINQLYQCLILAVWFQQLLITNDFKDKNSAFCIENGPKSSFYLQVTNLPKLPPIGATAETNDEGSENVFD